MSRQRLIDADATAGNTAEERVKRNRLVGPEELNRPLGGSSILRSYDSSRETFNIDERVDQFSDKKCGPLLCVCGRWFDSRELRAALCVQSVTPTVTVSVLSAQGLAG